MFTLFTISFLLDMGSMYTYFPFSFSDHNNFDVVVYRPMVPQLAPPKIPEGERVDFDVSGRIKVSCCRLNLLTETRNKTLAQIDEKI